MKTPKRKFKNWLMVSERRLGILLRSSVLDTDCSRCPALCKHKGSKREQYCHELKSWVMGDSAAGEVMPNA